MQETSPQREQCEKIKQCVFQMFPIQKQGLVNQLAPGKTEACPSQLAIVLSLDSANVDCLSFTKKLLAPALVKII